MTSTAADKQGSEGPAGRRVVTRVSSLGALVGAHPSALRSIYGEGVPADPAELGDAPRGRLLTVVPGSALFLAARPIVRAISGNLLPWQGKTFDHGGNSGQNVVFGKRVFRFRCERGESAIDAGPTLVLTYSHEAFGNPWPARAMVDELRMVGDGVAIGPAFFNAGSALELLFWFGLEADR